MLYNQPRLVTANVIAVCEGEKDADNVAQCGLWAERTTLRLATSCNFDGARRSGEKSKWLPAYNVYFAGKFVIVFADNDENSNDSGTHSSLWLSAAQEVRMRLKAWYGAVQVCYNQVLGAELLRHYTAFVAVFTDDPEGLYARPQVFRMRRYLFQRLKLPALALHSPVGCSCHKYTCDYYL